MRLFLFILIGLLFSAPLVAQDRITGKPFATRSEVIARNGMAATSQPLATQVAIDILKAGGSAVDAAIAANAALGLMEPTGNGDGRRSVCDRVDRKREEAVRPQRERSISQKSDAGETERGTQRQEVNSVARPASGFCSWLR